MPVTEDEALVTSWIVLSTAYLWISCKFNRVHTLLSSSSFGFCKSGPMMRDVSQSIIFTYVSAVNLIERILNGRISICQNDVLSGANI